MDVQTKKLHFVQEFLRRKDENLIDKLSDLLRIEKKKIIEKEFNDLIDGVESDSENVRLTSDRDLKNEIDLCNYE